MVTKEIDHASRDHATFGPSSMSRLVACPASGFLSKEIPNPPSTAAADEGTLGHEVSEIMLEAKLTDTPYPKSFDEKYDKEMIACGKAYAEFIYGVIEPHLSKRHFWAIEKRLINDSDRDIWGTADFVFVYKEDGEDKKNIIIIDYKYGTWAVSPKKNWQLAAYAWGAIEEFGGIYGIEKVDKVSAYIFQPRCAKKLKTYKPEPWTISADHLDKSYIQVMSSAVDLIIDWVDSEQMSEEDAAKYTTTGSHCHFCRAKGVCNAYKEAKSGPTLAAFKRAAEKLDKKELGNKEAILTAGVISLDELTFIALNKSEIIKFIEAASQIPAYMIMRGDDVPGLKLVEQNPRRSFIKDTDSLIKGLKALGILNPVQTVEKVITLTEAEKRIGKNKLDHLLTVPTEKSYKLVAEDHKDAAVEFGVKTNALFTAAAKRMKNKEK